MKNLFKINIALTLLIVFIALVSFTSNDEVLNGYTHHYEESWFGRGELIPSQFRRHDPEVGGYYIGYCPNDLLFNCRRQQCVADTSYCGCG